jgi:hypothetical protein
VLASGVTGILLSLYLWASIPVTAIWLLGVLLDIELICEGTALGYLAWQVDVGVMWRVQPGRRASHRRLECTCSPGRGAPFVLFFKGACDANLP